MRLKAINRFDFFETNLTPGLKTNQSDLMKSIEQYENKFNENKERLELVRIEKAKQREKELESMNFIRKIIHNIL